MSLNTIIARMQAKPIIKRMHVMNSRAPSLWKETSIFNASSIRCKTQANHSRHILKAPSTLPFLGMLIDIQQAPYTTELTRRRSPRNLLETTVQLALCRLI